MTKTKKWCAFALACGCSIALSVAGLSLIQTQTQADASQNAYGASITSETDGTTMTLLYDEVAEFALNYTVGSAINYLPENGVATDRYVPKPATIS